MIEADQREAGKTGLPLEALRSVAMQAPIVLSNGIVDGWWKGRYGWLVRQCGGG